MLALDKPLGEANGMALFADHADPKRVYYLPGAPRIARLPDGTPEYRCVAWHAVEAGDRAVAGAVLSFTTELAADPESLEEARRALRASGVDDPVLTPVTFIEGKAVLATALAGEGGLVEAVLAEVPAELVGDNRALLSFRAPDAASARLVTELARLEGPSPIGVRYELTFVGLRPAYQVRITADYSRMYDELSVGFKLGFAYQDVGVKVAIESATRRLRESGALQVEVLTFTDDDDVRARVEAATRWFQEEIQRRFFHSALTASGVDPVLGQVVAAALQGAGSVAAALANPSVLGSIAQKLGLSNETVAGALRQAQTGGGAGAALPITVQLGFSLKDIHTDELRVETVDLSEARAERRTFAPQGLLSFLGARTSVIELDLGAAFPMLDVAVRPLGDFAAMGVERLVVELAWPADGPAKRQDAYVFDAGDPTPRRFAAWADEPSPYRWRAQVHFVDGGRWPGADLSWQGDWVRAETLELAIHPIAHVPRFELDVSLSNAALDGVSHVEVGVWLDGAETDRVVLDASNLTSTLRRRIPEGSAGRLAARPCWVTTEGERIDGDLTEVEGATFVIGSPWRSRRRLRLVPMLPAGATDAIVTLTPVGEEARARTILLDVTAPRPTTVDLPSLQEPPPPVRVEVTIVRADLTVFTGEPFETDALALVVTDRDGRLRRVAVRLVAPERLADAGVLAVSVQLVDEQGEELDRALFTGGTREPASLLVPEPVTAPFSYRVRVTRYGLDGAAAVGEVEMHDEATLIVTAAPPQRPPEGPG